MGQRFGWMMAAMVSIPAVANGQGYGYGAQPAARPPAVPTAPMSNAPMASRPAAAKPAVMSPIAPRLTNLALPVIGPQPYRVAPAQPAAGAPLPSVASANDPLGRPASPFAAPGNAAYGPNAASAPSVDPYGRRAPGASVGATRESPSSRLINSALITGTLIQPVALEQPRDFASAPQSLPVFTLDPAGLLGGFRDTATAAPSDSAAIPNLSQNSLGVISYNSLALQELKFDGGQSRIVNLSLPVLTYAPPGPEAALAGFVPSRVLPWPGGGGARPGFNAAPPEPPAYRGVGNPLGYNSAIGMALNAFSMIGSRLGSGMPSLPRLPGLGR